MRERQLHNPEKRPNNRETVRNALDEMKEFYIRFGDKRMSFLVTLITERLEELIEEKELRISDEKAVAFADMMKETFVEIQAKPEAFNKETVVKKLYKQLGGVEGPQTSEQNKYWNI